MFNDHCPMPNTMSSIDSLCIQVTQVVQCEPRMYNEALHMSTVSYTVLPINGTIHGHAIIINSIVQ